VKEGYGVANWKGVSIYDGRSASGGWHSYTKADGIVDDWVYAMAMDQDGVVWLGTEGGVSRHDGKTGSVIITDCP